MADALRRVAHEQFGERFGAGERGLQIPDAVFAQASPGGADRIGVAVEELIRWTTPVLNMCRVATRDATVRGQSIPEGDQLVLMYGSANRDESVFPDGQTFDVTREPNPHISFGFGSHFCLGAALARLEIRVMFEELTRRLDDWAFADDIGARRIPNAFVPGIRELPVTFRAVA